MAFSSKHSREVLKHVSLLRLLMCLAICAVLNPADLRAQNDDSYRDQYKGLWKACKATRGTTDELVLTSLIYSCTPRGWAVLESRDRVQECFAVDPTQRLAYLPPRNSSQSPLLRLSNLKSDAWLLDSRNEVLVKIMVDKELLYSKRHGCKIHKHPPLRYIVEISEIPSERLEYELKAGKFLYVSVGERNWQISLKGSRDAIERASTCWLHE